MLKLNNEIRSKLTEHQNNYKLCNLNLLSCYGGLYPATLTKLSLVIFNQILSNKMYHKKESKYYDPLEDKRIYTNIPITPTTLLENCHPVKYRLEMKDSSKDAGNVVKRINDLDENNIFYVWKLGYPKNYMFILERDIGLWRFYNPNAYVTPKTVKKIILSAKGMCNSMYRILKENEDKSSIHDVRNSFCEFVSRILGKMSPEINKDLDRWDEGRGYKEYLINLNKKINELSLYEGLKEDEYFYKRLPLDIQMKLSPKTKERNKHNELDSELSPKNDNLVNTVKKKKRERIPTKEVEAKYETFSTLEPLKDSKSFIQYYRSVINSVSNDAVFHEYKVEVGFASKILDIIKESDHDVVFLRSWILHYINLKLKGNNIKNKEKTSLKAFQETYEEYNSRYIGCGV